VESHDVAQAEIADLVWHKSAVRQITQAGLVPAEGVLKYLFQLRSKDRADLHRAHINGYGLPFTKMQSLHLPARHSNDKTIPALANLTCEH
jgi:hypothetical protein